MNVPVVFSKKGSLLEKPVFKINTEQNVFHWKLRKWKGIDYLTYDIFAVLDRYFVENLYQPYVGKLSHCKYHLIDCVVDAL